MSVIPPPAIKLTAKTLFKESDFLGKIVVAAVSGGSDSLALLFLLNDYLSARVDGPRLVAVTVDHGLRPEAAAEAQWVGEVCRRHHIVHETVRWLEPAPLRALSEEARIARYNLLCRAAEKFGSNTIMTGHTMDDQVETYTMRLQRLSKRGLSAMARESRLAGKFRLIRPLLSCRRQHLRDYLEEKGLGWVNDPSNENEAYERVRIRKSIKDESVEEAMREIAQARELRRKQSRVVASLIKRLKPILNGEILEIAPFPADIHDYEELGFTFGVLAAVMGGAPFLPPDRQVSQLTAFCSGPVHKLERATLVGALIEKSPKGWRIWRENRSLMSKTIKPGETVIWDGRFRIENKSTFSLHVGTEQLTFVKELVARAGIDGEKVHFPSLLVSPVIREGELVDMPALNGGWCRMTGVTVSRVMNPFEWLVSGDDFAMTDILAPLFGVKTPE